MKKEVKIVMLPADDVCGLLIHKAYDNPKHLWLSEVDTKEDNSIWQPQHLYFISDDEINENDWCIDLIAIPMGGKPKLRKATKDFATDSTWGDNDAKKIIATTNPKLNLPKPSKEFIKEYCEKGGVDKVNVEYSKGEHIPSCLLLGNNNEISISPIKESWNREEVVELLRMYGHTAWRKGCIEREFQDWIKENL